MYDINWLALLPLLLFVGLGLVTMLLSVAMRADSEKTGYFTLAGLAGTGIYTSWFWAMNRGASFPMFKGMLTVDGFSLFFTMLFVIIAALATLTAIPYLTRDGEQRGEFYSLMLFSLVGMIVMVSSTDLITLFLGFETMSLAIYVLVGWRRHAVISNEAVLKYFFLGSFAAGIFLYGIALTFGTTGSTNLVALHQVVTTTNVLAQPLLMLGLMMILAAVAFKVAAFPFHMWMPDVYEGAPTPVTGFMATAVKAAAFGMLIRMFMLAFGIDELGNVTYHVLWGLAIVTMFLGNAFALVQQNIKRMLAYSSIAHTGYLLIAIIALPNPDAASAIMYYLVAYAFTNLGALACISFLNGRDEKYVNIADLAGAAWKHPLVGLGMAVAMFSLIGFPPTAGFFAKYYLFIAAFKSGLAPLVVVAIVNSILSVFYYLRVVVVMYMAPADTAVERTEKLPGATKVAIVYAMVAVLWAGMGWVNLTGLLPGAGPLLDSAKASVRTLSAPVNPPSAMR
jgi:NADH-quinone oxidoreductase subunit N